MLGNFSWLQPEPKSQRLITEANSLCSSPGFLSDQPIPLIALAMRLIPEQKRFVAEPEALTPKPYPLSVDPIRLSCEPIPLIAP